MEPIELSPTIARYLRLEKHLALLIVLLMLEQPHVALKRTFYFCTLDFALYLLQ